MTLRKGEIILLSVILISLALSLGCYWQLPDKIATGFAGKGASIWFGWANSKARIDADTGWLLFYSHKFFGTFAFSLLMCTLFLPYFAFARFKKRVDDERYKYYDRIIILLFGLLLSFQLFISLWNFGYRWQLEVGKIIIIWFGSILFLLGDVLVHAKPGWCLSWPNKGTLRNEMIWRKAHQTAGNCVKVGACLFTISLFFRWGFIISTVLTIASFVLIYCAVFIPLYPIVARRRLKSLQQNQERGDTKQKSE